MSNSVCILINSCPKYNYLAVICCRLIRRYAPLLTWTLVLATTGLSSAETQLLETLNVRIMNQTEEENLDFIESRCVALRILQKEYSFVLLLQDDFFLDREPMYKVLDSAIQFLQENPAYVCVRLMPCPGPTGIEVGEWKKIEQGQYVFSFQAGIWSCKWLLEFFEEMIDISITDFPKYKCNKNHYWLVVNPCETFVGADICRKLEYNAVGFPRAGPWSNAVFLSPWSYRPTAVEKGVLQPWAKEMILRENF
jgi:hypothetical protein